MSRSGDPLGAYSAYAYSYGNDLPDYPTIGVWPGSSLVTDNTFRQGRSFNGAEVCALDRARLVAGLAAAQQCFKTSTAFSGLLPSDLDGNTPPPDADAYVLGLAGGAPRVWRLHVDWAAAAKTTLTGPGTVAGVAAYDAPCGGACVAQPGVTQRLDALSDRLMYRLAYRNRGGVQGTYAPDGTSRWMGSIAMNAAGDIALGYSASRSTTSPSLRWAGRPATATAGLLGAELPVAVGGGSQTGLSRWGDCSSMRVDPVDDCTFWFTSEYLTREGSLNGSTRIAALKVSDCA